MGYDIKAENENWSAVISGTNKRFGVSKNQEMTHLCKSYNYSAPKEPQKRLEMLEILNEINDAEYYQIVLVRDELLNICYYYYSPHQRRSFAAAVRTIDKSNDLFEKYPKLLELQDK